VAVEQRDHLAAASVSMATSSGSTRHGTAATRAAAFPGSPPRPAAPGRPRRA
jgi:hypothetical protein